MRPLTDHCPKPLLPVAGKPLIVRQIERLRAAGIRKLVINTGHLGEQLPAALGDGAQLGVSIAWSHEPPEAYETAGGIRHALPLLGDAPFAVVNGDIHCDADLGLLPALAETLDARCKLAHLWLVNNPLHHPTGDFGCIDGLADPAAEPRHTFSGIGVYHPALFTPLPDGVAAPLGPLLRTAMAARQVGATVIDAQWMDIGTPERLAQLSGLLETAPAFKD